MSSNVSCKEALQRLLISGPILASMAACNCAALEPSRRKVASSSVLQRARFGRHPGEVPEEGSANSGDCISSMNAIHTRGTHNII
jgi:hypothetical protein